MTAGETPTCEVCDERPAEGAFGPDANPTFVCRVCAECAIDDGHMRPGDFEWWRPTLLGGIS